MKCPPQSRYPRPGGDGRCAIAKSVDHWPPHGDLSHISMLFSSREEGVRVTGKMSCDGQFWSSMTWAVTVGEWCGTVDAPPPGPGLSKSNPS